MNSIVYQYWYLHNTAISFYKKQKIIDYFYDAYHVYHCTEAQLAESGLLNKKEINDFIRLREKENIEQIYEDFTHSPFSFMTCEDSNYLESLKYIPDPVYGFFYAGKIHKLKKTVAIVGARRCSSYGKKIAFELGKALAQNGFTVISGMALGVDTASHQGCLAGGGKTIAVLGSGVDVIYPKQNNILYEEIVKNGAIISEYPMGIQPLPENFPRRNRIVAGLADTIVVVEAKEKSGSLITADLALDQGKDIYVVPGRIGDTLSSGCNKLAAQGAGIIYSVDQFVSELSEKYGESVVPFVNQKENAEKLTDEQMKVLELFDYYPKSLSQIMGLSKMDYLHLLSVIMGLVRLGYLVEVFKNHYVLA